MAIKFNRSQTFATNGTVTAPSLHNLVDGLDIYQSLITDQTNVTSVSTADELLIAIAAGSSGDAPKAVTVQELFQDALSAGTYSNANISETLSYGTATGTRLVSANATITTGTITTGVITTGVIPTLTSSTATFGTTTSTAATITSGTIANLASTTGTIATLNSTTGTIGNLSTTLAGDFTISSGTSTLGTTGVTAGTYGDATAIPFLTVDAKGRITSATTGTFSSTPADGSITPAKLSQPLTIGTAVASTSGTAIDFTGIPSWAKQVKVIFNGVSTSGISKIRIRLGTSGGFVTSGYLGSCLGNSSGSVSNLSFSDGFDINDGITAAATRFGIFTFISIDTNNNWVLSGSQSQGNSTVSSLINGTVPLGGTLTQIRITTANGSDTFDAGTINIIYQG
jgi:hypothetical protein